METKHHARLHSWNTLKNHLANSAAAWWNLLSQSWRSTTPDNKNEVEVLVFNIAALDTVIVISAIVSRYQDGWEMREGIYVRFITFIPEKYGGVSAQISYNTWFAFYFRGCRCFGWMLYSWSVTLNVVVESYLVVSSAATPLDNQMSAMWLDPSRPRGNLCKILDLRNLSA